MGTKKTMNGNLHKAKKQKNDEFYTQMKNIEDELKHYQDYFKNKTVYCNCDDPSLSNFVRYFAKNFHKLGLKKLIASCYSGGQSPSSKALSWEFYGGGLDDGISVELDGDGDFRSDECVKMLIEADVVVTNPPFSLLREYIAQLIKYKKDFLIMGNQNTITYKEIFPLIQNNVIWLGVNTNKAMYFEIPDTYYINDTAIIGDNGERLVQAPAISWFTNIKHHVNRDIVLKRKYKKSDYKKYDNYDAINVDRVADIPYDYDGVMGVPITFLNKYNSAQFSIVKFRKGDDGKDLSIKGRIPYFRILIKRNKHE